MKIVIDERESDLFDKCSLLMQNMMSNTVTISKQVLHIGDIIIKTDADEELLILERKTFMDLLASIKDGRYEEQSYRLLHSSGFRPHSVIYLLEGMFSTLKYPSDKKIIFSAMTSLQFFKGFSIHRTATIQETAEWLLHMAGKIGKELENGKQPYYVNSAVSASGTVSSSSSPSTEAEYCSVVKKVKKDNVTPENIGEIMLCQIPGISSGTAIAIMRHFEGGFPHFLEELKKNPDCIENIVMEIGNGKSRKISKSCIENIRKYLLTTISLETEPCPL